MATYKLEETPDIFVCPYFSDILTYRMDRYDGGSTVTFIREIDLRKDKLIVHGTEINESLGLRLGESLQFKQKRGKLFVNCNGECYVLVIENNIDWIIQNNGARIFEWSAFGVIVPNSVNDTLRRELQLKGQDLLTMSDALSSAKNEVEELKKQLSTARNNEQGKETELHKVSTRLSAKDFELEATRVKLELCKEFEKELLEKVSSFKEENKNMETELQLLQRQSKTTSKIMRELNEDVQAELQSFKKELQSSNETVMKDLECVLTSCMKENYQGIATELIQKVRNEISYDKLELQSTKSQLESSRKRVIELEEELSNSKMESKVKDERLHYLEMDELQSVKVLLELTG